MSSGGDPAAPSYSFDFDAEPSTAETVVWSQFSEVLAKAPTYLRNMTEYKGCDAVIRQVRFGVSSGAMLEMEA